MDGRSSRSRNEGTPPATSNEGSPKAGSSSWTGSWPGSRHGPRPERAEGGGRAAMGKVTSDVSVSLDGFVTGPNVGVGNGMGDDGDRLHDWMFDAKTETDGAF